MSPPAIFNIDGGNQEWRAILSYICFMDSFGIMDPIYKAKQFP